MRRGETGSEWGARKLEEKARTGRRGESREKQRG